jgi:hypothetical protein
VLGWIMLGLAAALGGVSLLETRRGEHGSLFVFFGVPTAFLSAFGYLWLYRKESRVFSGVAMIVVAVCGALIGFIVLLGLAFRGP